MHSVWKDRLVLTKLPHSAKELFLMKTPQSFSTHKKNLPLYYLFIQIWNWDKQQFVRFSSRWNFWGKGKVAELFLSAVMEDKWLSKQKYARVSSGVLWLRAAWGLSSYQALSQSTFVTFCWTAPEGRQGERQNWERWKQWCVHYRSTHSPSCCC